MGLADLFEFRTKAEEYKEVPWITEATEELIEDIVRKKYAREKEKMPHLSKELEETARRVEEVAKRFIKFCRKIGGKPKVREYASRHFGTIDMTCYFEDDARMIGMWYEGGQLYVSTNKGHGLLRLIEGLDKADIKIKDPENISLIEFYESYRKRPYFGASSMTKLGEISMDIYSDHVKIDFRSETYEKVIEKE